MRSVKTFISISCSHLMRALVRIGLPQPYSQGSQGGKRRNRWSEMVRNIDFSHSSRLAWNTINSLTGRSRQSSRQCPVSADAIAAQLVKNGKYAGVNRRSSRLVLPEVSDLWRADPLHLANVPGVSPIGSSLLPSNI